MVSLVHATSSMQPQEIRAHKPTSVKDPDQFEQMMNIPKLEQPMLKPLQMNPKNNEIYSNMKHLKANDPAIQKAYNEAMERLNTTDTEEGGTNIALKELAKQFENQIYAMMWNRLFKKEDEGSLAMRVWHPQLVEAFVEAGDNELGDIGECVYDQLLEEAKQRQMERLNASY